MKEKDEASCMAPQPAQKTELQCALEALVDAEKRAARMEEGVRAAEKAVEAARDAAYWAVGASHHAEKDLAHRYNEVRRLSRQ